jgi:hypothetical protein
MFIMAGMIIKELPQMPVGSMKKAYSHVNLNIGNALHNLAYFAAVNKQPV